MKDRIIIIGGLGYVGSNLYTYLTEKKYKVQIVDNHLYKEIHPIHPYINVDIRNKEDLDKLIKPEDIVVNLAAVVGDPACLVDTQLAISINCVGMRNISEICKKNSNFLIHISTCSIYGSEPNRTLKEENEGFPIDFYGQTKYTQERLARELCISNSCILRLGTVYGLSPRMRYDLVINSFIAGAVTDKAIQVFGGEQMRPFVHIQDVARAIEHVIEKKLKGVYNVSGESISLSDIGRLISEATGCALKTVTDITDKRSYVVDSTKIQQTGYRYTHNISHALNEITSSATIHDKDNHIYSNLRLMQNLKTSNLLKQSTLKLYPGGVAVDDRGVLSFSNEFTFFGVKRFYQVENFSTSTIRAFHGHAKEGKYVYVAKGSAIVAAVYLDDFKKPSLKNEVNRYVLSDKKPQVLYIPPGHANGFRPLEEGTRIIFFSTSSLEDSKGDDYRFPPDYWGSWVWEIENR
ncbi:MAG: NAD-dependent epimerase/dehydratase family protein [Spirochaetales bacterium]|nr:NAD-dependent epimerase/dehydratase family protein [Spirochaetales bacterium]